MNADIRSVKTAAELELAEAFAAARAASAESGQLVEQRASAFRHFEASGLPHRRVEEWKYTDLRSLMRHAKPLAAAPNAAARPTASIFGKMFHRVDARRLVFLDGTFIPEVSDLDALEPGLEIANLKTAIAENDPLVLTLGKVVETDDIATALNTAFMKDGAVIRIADHARIERPIHLVFAFVSTEAAAVFARSLVVVGAGARVTLVETFEGPAGIDYQVNDALEIVVGDEAVVERVKVGAEGDGALHLSTVMVQLGAGAVLRDLAFTTGGAVSRNQLFVRFAGDRATLIANSASLLKGRQHLDTTLVIDHATPGGVSRELSKSVLDGESRGVFQGKTIVRPGAQKTDGKMMSQALLLSDDAEADNKPELEIFADDVVCGHGATAGALDRDLVFYVKSRGVPQKEAEALLIAAFVGAAFDWLERDDLKEALEAATGHWLAARS
jgi:Fe-S cluster assembly protein SufD